VTSRKEFDRRTKTKFENWGVADGIKVVCLPDQREMPVTDNHDSRTFLAQAIVREGAKAVGRGA